MNGIKQGSGEEAPPPDQVGREYRTEVVTQFHLHNSSFEGQEQAVNELYQLALQHEGRLTLGVVRARLWATGARFTQELKRYRRDPTHLHLMILLDALADIVYCTVLEYSYTHHEPVLHLVGQCFAEPANIRLSQAYQAVLAKYRLPLGASQLDVYEAIRAALR